MKTSLVFVFVFAGMIAGAQGLSKDEKRIIGLVNSRMPQNLSLLEALVNINSGSLNVPGVKQVGEMLARQFDSIGFTTEWINLPDSLKRAGHLVAYTKGKKGKRLLLIGHLDTVFEPDMPANPYHLINDSIATGQGANDIKGGDLVILAALRALQQAGLLKNKNITAYFTGDEEKSGQPISVSRADFIARAKQHQVALAFESAQGLNTVASARRGSSSWQLSVTGRQAHSSTIFNNNYGAIYEAARILNTFREELSTEKYLTFNPGLIAGGAELHHEVSKVAASVTGKTNIISPTAVVQGDLRFLRETQKDSAREKMRQIVSNNNLAATSATIQFEDNLPAMEPTAGNQNLVEWVKKVSMDMGIGETIAGDPGSRGAGDISYIAQYLDCLDGLGASGSGAHAPGETINLKELPLLIQRAAILIYRLTR